MQIFNKQSIMLIKNRMNNIFNNMSIFNYKLLSIELIEELYFIYKFELLQLFGCSTLLLLLNLSIFSILFIADL